jgi:hypothetical protein
VSAAADTPGPACPARPADPAAPATQADAAPQADPTAQADTAAGRKRALVPPLLRDTAFRRYWSASSVSMVGDQVTTVAVPLTAVLALHAARARWGC